MKEKGVLKDKMQANTDMINSHFNNPTHNAIIAEHEKARTNYWNEVSQREEEHRLVVTNRCMRTGYLGIMKGFSFQSYPDMIHLQGDSIIQLPSCKFNLDNRFFQLLMV